MPVNGYNVGKDVTLQVIGQTGGLITLGTLTNFDAKQMTKKVESRSIVDGQVRTLEIPGGWEGTFEIDRSDSAVDDYFAQLEASYYAGQNIPGGIITETIAETNGGITQYRFTNVAMKLDDAGGWKQDDMVKQKIGWSASLRQKVI